MVLYQPLINQHVPHPMETDSVLSIKKQNPIFNLNFLSQLHDFKMFLLFYSILLLTQSVRTVPV
ncbi:hypothetical protein DPEC_G00087990 [Dallia pectoralis]|uniref:Uncharacterized protein n=1 Tax=Dallia pectoralis TaxID=75939 RepID=A0ACC2H0U6_DALPE|nr:hypothetical protein DPEC_G00087990 [Dallia pectoralis]